MAALFGSGVGSVTTKWSVATVIGILSALLSANTAFQFYQFPAMMAKSFDDEHKEVCISWLDGFGFLFSSPVWAATAAIVPTYGWASTWGLLSLLFAVGWSIMLKALPPVLAKEKQSTLVAQ